jgi:hypothetical protein
VGNVEIIMKIPPIWTLCVDLRGGNGEIDPPKADKYASAINNVNITGGLVPAPWDDTEFSLFTHVVAMSTKPFHVRFPTIPLVPRAPSILLNGNTCGKLWDPAYVPMWIVGVEALFDHITGMGWLGDFDGMRLSPVTPYPFDDEYGLEASSPTGARNDAVFAAEGYTPWGYTTAGNKAAAYIGNHPIMQGRLLSTALFTPGNQPRVNNAGQVVGSGQSTVPQDILAGINAGAPNCIRAAAYTTFKGTMTDFAVQAGETLGNTIIQLDSGLSPAATVAAFVAAVKLQPLRIEVHEDQVQDLDDAIAACRTLGYS